MHQNKSLFPTMVLVALLLLTVAIYLPGLRGGFLFDDFPNLGEMVKYGDLSHWDAAKKFILSGNSGPTGRPIALATFAMQSDSWPSHPFPFKLVNLLIHLLCGILLYWATLLLLRSYGIAKNKSAWIAILSTGCWLLHPLFVSTTLYVVQRMAQLAMLFGLLGIIGYLHGRATLKTRSVSAYIVMTLSIGAGTVLATFSKENGALLPLLILVIEFCNPKQETKPLWYWRVVCLWLPSLAILGLLAQNIDFSADPWPTRPFNQVERLLSEGRIICSYLFQLFVPRIEGYGLFQDGYTLSTGLLSPPSTFYSIIFLLILLITSFALKKKYPLLALAILFFFAAHLMESTVIGLELYFEHRNYVAAMFIFLPLAAGLYALSERIKPSIVILISVLIISLLASMTWQRTVLWSNTIKLQAYWAQNSPDSPRAQSMIARLLLAHDHDQNAKEANAIIERALQKHPESGLLSLQLLWQKIFTQQVVKQDFIQAEQRVLQQRTDAQVANSIQEVVYALLGDQNLTKLHGDDTIAILDALMRNPSYRQFHNFEALALFLQAQILLAQEKPEAAYQNYTKSLILSSDVESGLTMVALLGNAGYRDLALRLLDRVEVVYHNQSEKNLKHSKAFYDESIQQTRHDMQKDLEAEQTTKGSEQ